MIAADESRTEIDELAQFLASWQRVTVERLSGRVEVSEALDVGILAHVARLIGAERIVVSLVEPDGLRVVDGHPAMAPELVIGDSPSRRAVDTGEIFFGDLQEEGWGESVVAWRYTVDTGPVMAIPMVSGGETIGAVTVTRPKGAPPFTAVEAARALILVPPLAGAVRISSLSDELRRVNKPESTCAQQRADQPAGGSPAPASRQRSRVVNLRRSSRGGRRSEEKRTCRPQHHVNAAAS
jgi:hypothetical protein